LQTCFAGFVLLQIGKIAAFFRRPPKLLLGRDDVAVGASRHQAVLHLAGRGQFMSQPQSHHQQDHRDSEARDRGPPASASFGLVGHRQVWSSNA
jgi:hypothetical protein